MALFFIQTKLIRFWRIHIKESYFWFFTNDYRIAVCDRNAHETLGNSGVGNENCQNENRRA